MKKIIFLLFFLSFTTFIHSQPDLLAAKTKDELQKTLDSAMRSFYFITVPEAEKIMTRPVYLKDSTYRFSSGILRYSFDYVAKRIDSTSKGRIFFSFEQYKDPEIAKGTYQSIKVENEKSGAVTVMSDLGEDAFLQKDALNQPFLIIKKGNKIYKLKIYSITSQNSLDELIVLSKKIIASH